MRLVTGDFETYFDADYSLRKLTTEQYLRDPRYETIMLAAQVNDDKPEVAWGDRQVRELLGDLQLDRKDTVFVAHNGRFDGSIIEWKYGIKINMLLCTILMMRETGLSRLINESLSSLADFLREQGYPIPRKGHEVTLAAGLHLSDMSAQFRRDYERYCLTDNAILRAAVNCLMPHCSVDALRAMNMSLQMYTRPVLRLDKPLLEEYLAKQQAERQVALETMAHKFDFQDVETFLKQLRSKPKFAALLERLHVEPPMKLSEKKTAKAGQPVYDYAFAKGDLEFKALLEHENPEVVQLVEARLGHNSSINESRTKSFIGVAERGPLPVPLEYAKAHCVPGETEVLTPDGWVPLTDWTGGTIMQASPNGTLQWATATRYVGPVVVNWYGWADKRYPCPFTEGHTMAVRPAWGAGKTGFTSKPIELCSDATRIRAVVSGSLVTDAASLTADQMRCVMMVQADGSYYAAGKALRLHFKKQRKIVRCRQRLTACNIPYTESVQADGTTTIRVLKGTVPGWLLNRKLLTPDLWNQPADVLAAAVEESPHWDGTIKADGTQRYTSSNKQNAEWVATAAHLSGRKAVLSTDTQMYVVTLPTRARDNALLDSTKFTKTALFARAYCTQTQTGFWLARYQGVIFITGNTGRYGGSDKINLQNLPKRTGDKTLRKSILAPAGFEIGGADSSQVEARLLAYAAQERGLLSVFETGGDPYCYMAESIYGESSDYIRRMAKEEHVQAYITKRNVGKETVLGSGYGMSGNKFSMRLKQQGIFLQPTTEQRNQFLATVTSVDEKVRQAALVDYEERFHEAESKRINRIYRKKNEKVVAFWNVCERVLGWMVEGRSGYFGGPDGKLFFFDGNHKVFGKRVPGIMLPNGFWLLYHNLRTFQEETANGRLRTQYMYDFKEGRNFMKKRIYGGALTENLIQALAFAVLKWQAVRIHAKLPVRMNVHDEWMSVYLPAQRAAVKQLYEHWMRKVPDWVRNAPLDCEFSFGNNYGEC